MRPIAHPTSGRTLPAVRLRRPAARPVSRRGRVRQALQRGQELAAELARPPEDARARLAHAGPHAAHQRLHGRRPLTAGSWTCRATATPRVPKRERDEWQGMIERYLAKRPSLRMVFVLIDAEIGPTPLDDRCSVVVPAPPPGRRRGEQDRQGEAEPARGAGARRGGGARPQARGDGTGERGQGTGIPELRSVVASLLSSSDWVVFTRPTGAARGNSARPRRGRRGAERSRSRENPSRMTPTMRSPSRPAAPPPRGARRVARRRRFRRARLHCIRRSAPAREILDAARLRLALQKLQVTGSALFVAGIPTENTAMLAWLSSGKKVRTGYLSMTRGDGGQNLIGTEIGEQLAHPHERTARARAAWTRAVLHARSTSASARTPRRRSRSGAGPHPSRTSST